MFKRIGNLIKGFFGLFISKAERANPEALLEVEKENLRKMIAEYNKGLASHAGLCERLITQVRKLDKEEAELKAKAGANLKAGNKKLAGTYALRLQKVRAELEENRGQAETAEKTYKELVHARDVSVRSAREKIDEIARGIGDAKVQKAMADLNEMASGMITDIGGSGDTLDRLHEMVEESRTEAAGRLRVAKDGLDTTEIGSMAAEQEAMEEMALADLAAEMGMEVEGDGGGGGASEGGATETTRSMGESESA
jgi:phage shock protein A